MPTATPTVEPTPTESTAPAITVRRLDTVEKIVTLTFDAGADRGYAPDILALLRKDGIKATFGLTGRWAEGNPDLVREMVIDGHELMNHTYDHHSFTGYSAQPAVLTRQGRIAELQRAERVVQLIAGVTLKPLFRPPYGDQDASVLRDVGSIGYRYSVLWTVDSGGWEGFSVERILARCLAGAVPGAIYVFHVGRDSRDVAAIPSIIQDLRRRGYTFQTIGQLLHLPATPAPVSSRPILE